MKHYYYSATDRVWHTWSESELKGWLVSHGIVKSEAQKKRDELVKLVECVSVPLRCGTFGANLSKGPLSVCGRQRLGHMERLGHSRVARFKGLSRRENRLGKEA